jgi:hypothetical protein
LSQKQQHELRLIRKEGSAVFQHLQSMIALREQIRLKSNKSLLSDRLPVFDRQIDIYQKYYLLLLSKDISAIAIFRGQRPYEQLPPKMRRLFSEVLFKLLSNQSKHKLYRNGDQAFRCGVVGFFLFNCYSCLNGSTCSSMFGLPAPPLEVYIPLEVDFFEVDVSAGIL